MGEFLKVPLRTFINIVSPLGDSLRKKTCSPKGTQSFKKLTPSWTYESERRKDSQSTARAFNTREIMLK